MTQDESFAVCLENLLVSLDTPRHGLPPGTKPQEGSQLRRTLVRWSRGAVPKRKGFVRAIADLEHALDGMSPEAPERIETARQAMARVVESYGQAPPRRRGVKPVKGQRRGRWERLERLAPGGALWRVREVLVRRTDAKGVIYLMKDFAVREADEQFAELSRAYALALERLPDVDGVIRVVEELRADGSGSYVVLEYRAKASTLKELVRGGNLQHQDVALIGARVAGSLARLHEAGVVHGDVSGTNVLVERRDDLWITTLCDLDELVGIDWEAPEAGCTSQRAAATFPAPEIWEHGVPRPESDVWALGCTLASALASKDVPPATAVDSVSRLAAAGVASAFVGVLRSMVDPEPTKRPSAAEAAARLEALPHRVVAAHRAWALREPITAWRSRVDGLSQTGREDLQTLADALKIGVPAHVVHTGLVRWVNRVASRLLDDLTSHWGAPRHFYIFTRPVDDLPKKPEPERCRGKALTRALFGEAGGGQPDAQGIVSLLKLVLPYVGEVQEQTRNKDARNFGQITYRHEFVPLIGWVWWLLSVDRPLVANEIDRGELRDLLHVTLTSSILFPHQAPSLLGETVGLVCPEFDLAGTVERHRAALARFGEPALVLSALGRRRAGAYDSLYQWLTDDLASLGEEGRKALVHARDVAPKLKTMGEYLVLPVSHQPEPYVPDLSGGWHVLREG